MGSVVWQEIKQYTLDNPMQIGDSVRIRHELCAHRHIDETLEIRRTEDGHYIGYCHRCGSGSGYGTGTNSEATYRTTKKPTSSKGGNDGLPEKRIKEIKHFPPQVRMWLAKCKITNGQLESEGVQYSTTRECILFPVNSGTVRRHYGEGMPKYTSSVPFQLRSVSAGTLYAVEKQGHTLVIVEDWLSCLQCYRAGYDSLALFTTSIRPAAMAEALKGGYERVIVALDNDNTTVKANQRKLLRQFQLVCDNVYVVPLEKDPKEYELSELQEILQ